MQEKRYTKSGYGESSPMTRTDARKVSRYSPVVSLAAPLRSKRPRPSRLATSHRGASAAAVHFTFIDLYSVYGTLGPASPSPVVSVFLSLLVRVPPSVLFCQTPHALAVGQLTTNIGSGGSVSLPSP